MTQRKLFRVCGRWLSSLNLGSTTETTNFNPPSIPPAMPNLRVANFPALSIAYHNPPGEISTEILLIYGHVSDHYFLTAPINYGWIIERAKKIHIPIAIAEERRLHRLLLKREWGRCRWIPRETLASQWL